MHLNVETRWRVDEPAIDIEEAIEVARAWAIARACLEWWQRPFWRAWLTAPRGITVRVADLDRGEFDDA